MNPNLIDGVTHIGTPSDPEYHFNIDMTDQAINSVRATHSLTPDLPFLNILLLQRRPPPTHPAKASLKGLCQGQF